VVPERKALIRWIAPQERPEVVAERDRQEKLALAKRLEADTRLAQARTRAEHARMMATAQALVLSQLEKLQSLAASPDFANSPGPLEPKDLIKLVEFVSKDFRLSTGQATEHVAMAIGPSIDFGKLTQEERDAWRALALKGGAAEE
jgi:hypothetical protein